jgi:hypothetical protein
LYAKIRQASTEIKTGLLRNGYWRLIKLPAPELIRIDVSMTAKEYEGFSSRRMLF